MNTISNVSIFQIISTQTHTHTWTVLLFSLSIVVLIHAYQNGFAYNTIAFRKQKTNANSTKKNCCLSKIVHIGLWLIKFVLAITFTPRFLCRWSYLSSLFICKHFIDCHHIRTNKQNDFISVGKPKWPTVFKRNDCECFPFLCNFVWHWINWWRVKFIKLLCNCKLFAKGLCPFF